MNKHRRVYHQKKNQCKHFLNIFFITGKELPTEIYGVRMTPTKDGKGLLMTFEKGVYGFNLLEVKFKLKA